VVLAAVYAPLLSRYLATDADRQAAIDGTHAGIDNRHADIGKTGLERLKIIPP
jgi:hypothetical protein